MSFYFILIIVASLLFRRIFIISHMTLSSASVREGEDIPYLECWYVHVSVDDFLVVRNILYPQSLIKWIIFSYVYKYFNMSNYMNTKSTTCKKVFKCTFKKKLSDMHCTVVKNYWRWTKYSVLRFFLSHNGIFEKKISIEKK